MTSEICHIDFRFLVMPFMCYHWILIPIVTLGDVDLFGLEYQARFKDALPHVFIYQPTNAKNHMEVSYEILAQRSIERI